MRHWQHRVDEELASAAPTDSLYNIVAIPCNGIQHECVSDKARPGIE
jgi:hypothetical protein